MGQEEQVTAVVRILKQLVDNFHQNIDWDEVEAYLLAGIKNEDETDKEFEEMKELGDAAIKTASKEPKKDESRLFSVTIPEFPDDDIPF